MIRHRSRNGPIKVARKKSPRTDLESFSQIIAIYVFREHHKNVGIPSVAKSCACKVSDLGITSRPRLGMPAPSRGHKYKDRQYAMIPPL